MKDIKDVLTDAEIEAELWSAYADGRDDERAERDAIDPAQRAREFYGLILLVALSWALVVAAILWWKS